MKKQYIKPACEVMAMESCSSILAGSKTVVPQDNGQTIDTQHDVENTDETYWIGAKGHSSIWDD